LGLPGTRYNAVTRDALVRLPARVYPEAGQNGIGFALQIVGRVRPFKIKE
jgi:hypothetical protein